jgi:hypothetical protein
MFTSSVEKWRALVAEQADGIPVDFVLAWIKHESGGNHCSLGIPGVEAGIFQTYHPDDDRFGASFAQLRPGCDGSRATRALTDDEKRLQVRVGLNLIRNCRDKARGALKSAGADWTEGAMDFWCVVKLRHALPAFLSLLSAYTRAMGEPPPGWRVWKEWVMKLSPAEVVAINSAMRPWSSPEQRARLLRNAEESGKYGGAEKLDVRTMVLLLAMAAALYLVA